LLSVVTLYGLEIAGGKNGSTTGPNWAPAAIVREPPASMQEKIAPRIWPGKFGLENLAGKI